MLANKTDDQANTSAADSYVTSGESQPMTNATADTLSGGLNQTHLDAKQSAISLLLKSRNRLRAKTVSNATAKTTKFGRKVAVKAAVPTTKAATVILSRAAAGARRANLSKAAVATRHANLVVTRPRKVLISSATTDARGASKEKGQVVAPIRATSDKSMTKFAAGPITVANAKPPRFAKAILQKDTQTVVSRKASANEPAFPLASKTATKASLAAKNQAAALTSRVKGVTSTPSATPKRLGLVGSKPAAAGTELHRGSAMTRISDKTMTMGAKPAAALVTRPLRPGPTKTTGAPLQGAGRAPLPAKLMRADSKQRAGGRATAAASPVLAPGRPAVGGSKAAVAEKNKGKTIAARAPGAARLNAVAARHTPQKASAAMQAEMKKGATGAAKTKLRE